MDIPPSLRPYPRTPLPFTCIIALRDMTQRTQPLHSLLHMSGLLDYPLSPKCQLHPQPQHDNQRRKRFNHNIRATERTMPPITFLPASQPNSYTKRLPLSPLIMWHNSNAHYTPPHPRQHTPRPHPHQQYHQPTNVEPTPSPLALDHHGHTPRSLEASEDM